MIEDQEYLSFNPKRNWHDRKKWNEFKRPRNVVKRWYIRPQEELTYNKNGAPVLTYPCIDPENNNQWTYSSFTVYRGDDIERKWFRKHRHHNDKGGRGWYTLANFVTGKSSRMGMKEKAKWWEWAQEAYDDEDDYSSAA